MKNLYIALAACISSQFIFGQSDRPKEIQLRGGVGISAYNTSTNLSYDVAGFPISKTIREKPAPFTFLLNCAMS